MLIVFCDLQKAFDTCNIEILLKKLQNVGITGTELRWFSSYLTDRFQYVNINGFDSNLLEILIGVPQGSILGPLLFLIYINDLPGCTELLSKLFADDTAIINEDDNLDRLIEKTNLEFQKICEYFRSNMLSLHPDKTKYILITNSPIAHDTKLSIFINNNNPDQNCTSRIHEINRVGISDKVAAIKYLGVYFDPGLNFKYHLNHISVKMSRSLYHLRCVKNILPPVALKSLYFALIHSHITYATEIWGSASQSLINELYVKQKAAIRIISNANFNSHTAPLFKSLNILPVPLLVKSAFINVMHRYHNKKLPIGFNHTWSTMRNRLDEAGAPVLRHEANYLIPFARTDQTSRFPLTQAPKLWNDLPSAIRNVSNPNSFNIALKEHLLSTLITTCTRLFCPACSHNQ
jgi:Reverse transcriptase (RNA-dependent DNA polymerase)